MANDVAMGRLLPEDLQVLLAETLVDFLGVPLIRTDLEGNALGPVEHPLAFCGAMVRDPEQPTYCLRRPRWDRPDPETDEAVRKAHLTAGHNGQCCCENFHDAAVPVVMGGKPLGYLVLPRILHEPPDIAGLREKAEAAGLPPEVGEQIGRAAYVVPPDRLRQIIALVRVLAELAARMAFERQQAEQIRELEGLRDSLVHMIVHDLRTPLTSIMGSLRTIMDTDYEDDLVREFVPMASSSSEQLLEMVNTLLDINKMESGKLELNVQAVRFDEVVRGALDQVRGLAVERGLDLDSEVVDTLPTIEGDPELLRRVLVNLLGNAIKFTPSGRVWVSAEAESDGLTFAVSDTGPGIAPQDQERIFDKFGQVQARAAGHKHSTGLGLTFCRMVVEGHGGRITVSSEIGQGSTFRVHLPARAPSQ